MDAKLLAEKYESYVVSLRREFHMQPELSGQEKMTSERIIKELNSMNIPFEMVGDYGIIATLEGNYPGKTVALRADMDALPMNEDTNNLAGQRAVISKDNKVAHLCGHDGHMAMLLGSIKALYEVREQLKGTVLFCFEQAEETASGVFPMLEGLSKKHIDGVWGIHLYSDLPSGMISVDAGPRMSGAGEFHVTIKGKGGHGSRPDQTIDPILCTAQIIVNLSTILSREINPKDMGVVTLGRMESGSLHNIIPETAYFAGTSRFFKVETGQLIKEAFIRIVENTAAANKCKAEINYIDRFPVVYNNEELAALAADAVKKSVGDEHLITCEPWMASESMSFYLKNYPGVFAFLGISNEKLGSGGAHHNPKFDIDESALKIGTAVTVQYVMDFLK